MRYLPVVTDSSCGALRKINRIHVILTLRENSNLNKTIAKFYQGFHPIKNITRQKRALLITKDRQRTNQGLMIVCYNLLSH